MTPEFFQRDYFESLQKKVFALLEGGEHLFLSLAGESSQFIRLNHTPEAPRIRQIGTVNDAMVTLTMVREKSAGALHRASRTVTLSGIAYIDQSELEAAMRALQKETREIPADPYAELPVNRGSSSRESRGELPSSENAPAQLIEPSHGLDLAGIYAAGPSVRAMADSAGTFHWFHTETFFFDHSIYTPEKRAVKSMYAGQKWNTRELSSQLHHAREQAEILRRPARKLERGGYRVYLAPPAFQDLVAMFSWGTIGEASIRQGDSPIQKIRSGSARFSPLFSLSEDFRGGESPRFNDLGELAPEHLPLIERGKLVNTLVSTRTAKEYGLTSNFASNSESLRAASVAAGDLAESDILRKLGTGLYLSNLHYLNWSDQPGGRITGMTRFACFWVERGEIVCPIENMRFDDTIFRFFGESLEALTGRREYIPEISSYGMRSLGGMWMPGALLSEMMFTI